MDVFGHRVYLANNIFMVSVNNLYVPLFGTEPVDVQRVVLSTLQVSDRGGFTTDRHQLPCDLQQRELRRHHAQVGKGTNSVTIFVVDRVSIVKIIFHF